MLAMGVLPWFATRTAYTSDAPPLKSCSSVRVRVSAFACWSFASGHWSYAPKMSSASL